MGGVRANVMSPNEKLAETPPKYDRSMGHTAEQVATQYGVSREEQDAFSVRSHEKAAAAIEKGHFDEEIVPVEVTKRYVDENNKYQEKSFMFEMDEGVRHGTTVQTLNKLRAAFSARGSVTAGNSSQTSDGAGALLVMEREKAEALGLKPIAKFRSFATGGVPPEVMGIGPIEAIPKALKLAGLSISDIDVWELNEAFASQSLAVIRKLNIDIDKVNLNGGAIALGHPLGATGSILTIRMLSELKRHGKQFGVVTMCIGGGMGAAGAFAIRYYFLFVELMK